LLGRAGGRASFPRHAEVSASEKAFGVYRHRNLAPASPYLRGFSDDFSVPVSRWTEVHREDIPPASGLQALMESDETGLCLLHDPAHRALHMFNHIEYDSSSLADEYFRDVAAGKPIAPPSHYFSEGRSNPPTGKPLAQPRTSAVRQLDQ
jgi:homoserine O-succinyltransferase